MPVDGDGLHLRANDRDELADPDKAEIAMLERDKALPAGGGRRR
jgi:hypothetical protein